MVSEAVPLKYILIISRRFIFIQCNVFCVCSEMGNTIKADLPEVSRSWFIYSLAVSWERLVHWTWIVPHALMLFLSDLWSHRSQTHLSRRPMRRRAWGDCLNRSPDRWETQNSRQTSTAGFPEANYRVLMKHWWQTDNQRVIPPQKGQCVIIHLPSSVRSSVSASMLRVFTLWFEWK